MHQFYLHSSWGCFFSYFSRTWDTPKSGCNQWRASECKWVRRRPREDTQRILWISAIFCITPCWNKRIHMFKNLKQRQSMKINVPASYPDICRISVPDITGPGARFAVCLKVMEDLKNPVHGAQGALQTPSRATSARTTRHASPGFNPTTTRCGVIKAGFQVGRRCHTWFRRGCWG